MKFLLTTILLVAAHAAALSQTCPPADSCGGCGDCEDNVASKLKTLKPETLREMRKGGYILAFQQGKSSSCCDAGPSFTTTEAKTHAKSIAKNLKELGIPVSTVLSSDHEVAFSFASQLGPKVQKSIDEQDCCSGAESGFDKIIGAKPKAGTNTIISAHQLGNITIEEGECVVIKPAGNGKYQLIARMGNDDWNALKLLVSSGGR